VTAALKHQTQSEKVTCITFLDRNRRHQLYVHSLDSTQNHSHHLQQATWCILVNT